MKCHQIQYFDADKSLEWAPLAWLDRPTSVRRAGESKSTKYKAKQEASLVGGGPVALPGPVKEMALCFFGGARAGGIGADGTIYKRN
jgi:hypothetical protein